jgi:hypothetical protein
MMPQHAVALKAARFLLAQFRMVTSLGFPLRTTPYQN